MTALVALGLNENHLVELPPEIGKLTNLQMLGTWQLFRFLIFLCDRRGTREIDQKIFS